MSTRLDYVRLQAVLDGFQKAAFVPMPGGQAEPVAGSGPMTAGMAAPMGGAPMDPAAMGGAPMDPAAMGGAPIDPAAMGGAPIDPAMLQALAGGGSTGSTISMTIPEFIQLIQVIRGEGTANPDTAEKPKKTKSEGAQSAPAVDPIQGVNQKLDQILAMAGGGAQPPMPAPMGPPAGMAAPPMM